jgi:DNA-binding FrmR family transcriptional regulator
VRGYYENKEDLLARLKRIEGQMRGLQRMVEEDKYCIDILTQITAANKALNKVAIALLEDHMKHCVAEAISGDRQEGQRMVLEASAAIERLVKS